MSKPFHGDESIDSNVASAVSILKASANDKTFRNLKGEIIRDIAGLLPELYAFTLKYTPVRKQQAMKRRNVVNGSLRKKSK